MNTKTKKLLTKLIFLILAMVMTFSLFLLNACGTDSTENVEPEDENESSLATDEISYLKNGSFSFFTTTDEKASYPRTPQNWKYSVDSGASSSSSNLVRGIMNVSETSFNDDKNKEKFPRDDGDNNKKWSIDATGDYVNPGKPAGTEDDYVLMVNNKAKTSSTAGRYTSDSFEVPKNAMVLLTGYVKTYLPADAPFGAHINIIGDIPGSERILVKDIKTDGEWIKFSIAVKASEILMSDLQIQLGLGYGDNDYEVEYTKGFAFFDEVEATFMSKADFTAFYASATTQFRANTTDKADNIATVESLTTGDEIKVAYDCVMIDPDNANININFDNDSSNFVSPNGTHGKISHTSFSDTMNSYPELAEYDAKENMITTSPFSSSDKVIALNNKDDNRSDIRFTNNNTNFLNVKTSSYYRVSVWVKTSEMRSGTGLSIYLYPLKNGAPDPDYTAMTFKNIDTTTSAVDTNLKSSYSLKYQNWQQYSFFIEGSDFGDTNYGIEFRLGPDTPIGVEAPNPTEIPYGVALINDIEIERVTQSYYNSISTSSIFTTQSLKQSSTVGITNGDFSSITTDNNKFENPSYEKPLYANGWSIFQQGEKAVGGNNVIDVPNSLNDFSYGIIDSNHLYSLDNQYKPADLSESVFGKGTPRVYMMNNITATALGIKSSSISVSSSTYARISVRVYVGNGATANVYLVDGDGAIVGIPEGEELGTKTMAYKNIAPSLNTSGEGFADSNLGNGWKEFSFFVKTGDFSKTYYLEIWNGSREVAEGDSDLSQGFLLVDNAKYETMTLANFEADQESYKDNANMTFADFSEMDIQTEEDSEEVTLPDEVFPDEFDWSLFGILLFSCLMVVALVAVLIRRFTSKGHYKLKAKSVSKNYNSEIAENDNDLESNDTEVDSTEKEEK